MYRYIAFIWNAADSRKRQKIEDFKARLMAREQWSLEFQSRGLLFLRAPAKQDGIISVRLANDRGIVLGTLFKRTLNGEATSIAAIDEDSTDRIEQSKGKALVDEFWGRYVAFIWSPRNNTVQVVRDPMEGLNCFYTFDDEISIFFSNVADCTETLGLKFTVNKKYLSSWLVSNVFPNVGCGLNNVGIVQGGEGVSVSPTGREKRLIWQPTKICTQDRIEDEHSAQKLLFEGVQKTIWAWASNYDRIVLSLSGGLDSSIVAGCLASAPSKPKITSFNLFFESNAADNSIALPDQWNTTLRRVGSAGLGLSDERRFARAVAARHGLTLVEVPRTVSSVDLTRASNGPLTPSPNVYVNVTDLDDIESRLVQKYSADAFFTGQAGDSVFCATTSPNMARDYAYDHGLGGGKIFQYIREASQLSGSSYWTVLKKALLNGLLRQPLSSAYIRSEQPHFLTAVAHEEGCKSVFNHPWLTDTDNLSPQNVEAILGMAGSCFYGLLAFERENHSIGIHPLHSQPIWELALRIPTYVMLAGGVSRGLARRAFTEMLPREVRERRTKGSGAPFYQSLIRANIRFVRESLLEGALVQEGFLDQAKLNQYLLEDQVFRAVPVERLLSYLGAEIWLRQWASISSRRIAA